jgi:HNH endonuclease
MAEEDEVRLSDRLYQQVDDSCALCGSRGTELLTIHHIDGNRENNVYENTIVLCFNCHERFHQNKGIPAAQILDRKRHLIHKTLTTYGLNALKIAGRNNVGVVAMPFLLHHVVELGYMEQNETVMDYSPGAVLFGGSGFISDDFVEDSNVSQVDAIARFSITASGRAMLSTWF